MGFEMIDEVVDERPSTATPPERTFVRPMCTVVLEVPNMPPVVLDETTARTVLSQLASSLRKVDEIRDMLSYSP